MVCSAVLFFEPFARNKWYLVNHMCQRMVELGTAAHTLRSHPTSSLCVFAPLRETLVRPAPVGLLCVFA